MFNLPDELTLHIFGFFGHRELPSCMLVSKNWHRIISNDLIWYNLLIRDFHYTEETAKRLKKTKNNLNYKELYRFCKSYQLNHNQIQALQEFQTSRQEFPSVASVASFDDGRFVVTWTSRDGQDGSNDVVYGQLFNSDGTKNGEEFQKQGITAEHLQGRDWFNECDHVDALRYLLNTKHLSADEAMQVLDGLTFCQARGIADGLTKEEVTQQPQHTYQP